MTETYFQAVAEVAKLAGDFALSHYGKRLDVETKQDGSPVTLADRGAEQLARKWIERRFPGDGILGEEFGTVRPDALRKWIVDPIDGTKSFVRSVPLWGTLVAVTEGERVLAGCIYCPAVNEIVVAATGQGCVWNGNRCQVSTVDTLSDATVVITDDRFLERPARRVSWSTVAERANVVRTWGDCYGYLLVATGRAEVMIDDITSPWDAAALQPIITEAGGVFTDWCGKPTAFGGNVIATNSALSQEVRSLLTESGS
ncbi:MAG TPA: histidinol-phosphatase [Gemmatimonadaceae bacterium]|jgi:histidinol-phosphatase|nr:histidinol-phosphatase [Gemmatimonadaceae bacterium]